MNDIQSQIKARLDSFAAEMEALIRRAALEAVGSALGPAAVGHPRPVVVEPKAAPKPTPARGVRSVASKPKAAAKSTPRGVGTPRRSSEAMVAVTNAILTHIKAHPGERAESIRAAVGLGKNVWSPAIKVLLTDKTVSSSGVKRATTYTAK